jgi:hypothetical protein
MGAQSQRLHAQALLHRGVKIDGMSGLTIDASHERRALLGGQHLGPGGVASWASDLANSSLLSVGLHAEAPVSTFPAEAEWSVVVRRSERTVVLIDADDDPHDHDSIDRLELMATRRWRDVTRHSSPGEMRPWLGAIRVISIGVADALVVERLEQLVASRILDAACVAIVDQLAGDVGSPTPALSVEAFKAALTGRYFVLNTLW